MSAVVDREASPGEVAAVELWRVQYPMRHEHRAAHGTEATRDLIVVRAVLADGSEGWGECATLSRPTYSYEHTAGAWAVLRDELVPAALAGREPGVVGHPSARCGVVTAVTDALLRRVERRLAVDLAESQGTNPRPAVARCAVVGRRSEVGEVVEAVAELIAQSVGMVKLKVSPDRRDLAAVGAVRTAWPDLDLAVDFNGTADLEALRHLDRFELAYIEQPAPAEELVVSAHLAQAVGTPIALDESITGPGSLDVAVALAAGSVVNVKPARCGGPHAAASLLARARVAGWEAFVGGMLESGVGRAAALAVASLPAASLPTDLGPSSTYVDEDLTEPIEADDFGNLVVPAGPGIGRTPDRDRLEALAIDHLLLER